MAMLQRRTKFSDFSVGLRWTNKMFFVENYETVSKFPKVMSKMHVTKDPFTDTV